MRAFWSEFQRRNVFRVGVAYLAVAWLLIQLVNNLAELLDTPSWVGRVTLIAVVAGWPVALVLSWMFESGVVVPDAPPPERSPLRHRLNLTIVTALTLAVLVLLTDKYLLRETTAATTAVAVDQRDTSQRAVLPNSVAVLPFANLSPDPANEYFSAGIHSEILDQLGKLKNLSVIARTSVMQYANTARNITEIAEELNVETVMEGTVSYAEGRVAIRVLLIDANTGVRLWSESYNRAFADIFGVQADIAMNIANALEAEFSTEETASLGQVPTTSSEAYTLYLQARALIASSRNDGRIQPLLEEALQLDPNFSAAHGLIALWLSQTFVNSHVGQSTDAARSQLAAKVEMHATRALELDSHDGNAGGALATLAFFQWDWSAAEEHFRRAVEAPHEPPSTVYLTYLLSYLGRHDEAIALAEQALGLDPENVVNGGLIGFANGMAGNYETALQDFRRHVRESSSPVARLWLAFMEVALGNEDEAAKQVELVDRMIADDRLVVYLPELAYGFGRVGRLTDAQRVFREIEAASAAGQPVGPGTWAMAHLAVGHQEDALRSLEAAADRAVRHEVDPGFFSVMNLKMNVTNDPVLREPRFATILDRIRGD